MKYEARQKADVCLYVSIDIKFVINYELMEHGRSFLSSPLCY